MDPQQGSGPTVDLSTLAWVQEELRKSLEAAHKALRRALKDVEAAARSDVDDIEPAVLRTARQQLHQAVGALELVNLGEGARMLRASETLVQRWVAKPQRLDAAGVDAVEHGSFAVLDYIARLLGGKQVSALQLFPQLKALLELSGAERVHPADLWPQDFAWRAIEPPQAVPGHAADAELLADVERRLLRLMRGGGGIDADVLRDDCAALAAGEVSPQMATLWRLAAAFFEAWGHGRVTVDLFVKRMASRVLSELRAQVRGARDLPERVAHDLLFHVARVVPADGEPLPWVSAAQAAWSLRPETPVDYTEVRLGRFDPA